MRRKALWICLMMAALALLPATKPVQAAPYVDQWYWVTPVYVGPDDYFGGTSVVAFKAGTTATLVVKVYSDLSSKAPFKVRVHMDWATTNQTSDEVEIQPNQWHTFQISISVPATASNLVLHSYKILVEYVEGATVKWLPTISGSNFAVYSADQVDAQQLKQEYSDWRNSYTGGWWLFGMTANARELWAKGAVEKSLGDESYESGSFSDAKTHYGNALNYTVNAVSSDVEKTRMFEDALTGLLDAGKGFLSMQGYAYLIASIGFLFIGIGAMIYLIRRSGHPKM